MNLEKKKTMNQSRSYYFPKYMERKEAIQKAFNEKSTKSTNTLQFKFEETKAASTLSKFIHKYLNNRLGLETSQIDKIVQTKSIRRWNVTLKENTPDLVNFMSNFRGQKSILDGIEFTTFGPGNAQENINITLTAVLRVFWYEHSGSWSFLKDHISTFANNVKILELIEETYKEEMKNIKNGVVRIKINYDYASHTKLLSNVGISKLGGQSLLVQISGHPPKCTHCLEFGHARRECEKAKLKCSKCNKIGHEKEQCSFAKQLQSNSNEDGGDYEEEDIDAGSELNKPKDIEQPNDEKSSDDELIEIEIKKNENEKENALDDAEKAKADAEKAKADAEKAKANAEKAKADVETKDAEAGSLGLIGSNFNVDGLFKPPVLVISNDANKQSSSAFKIINANAINGFRDLKSPVVQLKSPILQTTPIGQTRSKRDNDGVPPEVSPDLLTGSGNNVTTAPTGSVHPNKKKLNNPKQKKN